jgi:hypothetical protein
MSENSQQTTDRSDQATDRPDYSVEIEADELLSDIANMAAGYGTEYEENRRSAEELAPFPEARRWMLEARGGQRALSDVVAALQPENHGVGLPTFRRQDDTVDVRELMKWLSRESDATNDRRNTSRYNHQASEAHSAYCKVTSLLRDDYGVGWPRIDELGGVMECDLP